MNFISCDSITWRRVLTMKVYTLINETAKQNQTILDNPISGKLSPMPTYALVK